MSAKTRELGRFNPLRAFMRGQRYVQNEPRSYGFWAGLLTAGGGVAVMLVVWLPVIIADGDPLSFWPIYLSALLTLLVLPAAGAWVVSLFVRWLTKKGTIPRDADPSRQWAAQRLWRKGELSGDPKTDRLARGLTAQADRANSPRLLAVFMPLSVAPLGILVADKVIRGEQVSPTFGATLVFVLATWIFATPWALRQRRKAREFQEAYDARYGGLDEEQNGPGGSARS